ncbi:MAG: hypothetical protein M1821_008524 [Bathelium mastoideum]|nr:MAG: hypothetical protein M1821_008524 [Bathelium mastoideum]
MDFMKLEHYLRGPPSGDIVKGLAEIRLAVLHHGIPSNNDGISDLRIYIWLILLNAAPIKTDIYLDLVRQGPSPAYTKIRNDTFRTLATDPLFRRRVTENSLTRVLNAVAWKLHDAHEARVNGWQSPPTLPAPNLLRTGGSVTGSPEQSIRLSMSPGGRTSVTGTEGSEVGGQPGTEQPGYVQGMNVLAAPFLYAARSEAEAFVAFDTFLRRECPAYIRPSMDGVHRGLALVDRVLEVVEPKLAGYLHSKGLTAQIYGFASVTTLCACTPPLPEVLNLWDFLLAWGVHLNLLCIVAQLIIIKEQILQSSSPNQLLRALPPLQSQTIKMIVLSIVEKLPENLYQEIIRHAK